MLGLLSRHARHGPEAYAGKRKGKDSSDTIHSKYVSDWSEEVAESQTGTLDICNTPTSDRQTKGMTGEILFFI